ncbi:MAG: hypothetical protein SNF33_07665 [Candidatus Algichlamydia australiensis]|nr:hypothetical protein [Chlamydiales bacterium]
MSLKLIENPPYSVDLSQYSIKPTKDLNEGKDIISTVESCFEVIFKTTTVPLKSAWATLRYSPLSFRNIVFTPMTVNTIWSGLNHYSYTIPANPIIALVRIANWILSLAGCFVSTNFHELRKIYIHEGKTDLSLYGESGINFSHMRSSSREIDVSHIPEKIQVGNLLKIFETVNLSDPSKPGYVSAPEGKSEAKLKEGITRFVNCVQNRIAILGAPPAYDAPKVAAFYLQIENAVRASLYEVESKLEEFNRKNPNPENWTEENKNEYKNVLEDRSRLVVDLAGSGNHCATRFMGEAMECYYTFCGEGEIEGETLKNSLEDALAKKRLEIAKGQVNKHLGRDTHDYTNYMQSFGGVLGLPGTENIIEHLSSTLYTGKYLPLFFEVYTVDCIIEVVQERVKASQAFRDQITDWITDQMGEWKPEDDDDDPIAIAEKISEIQNNSDIEEHKTKKRDLETLLGLLVYLRGKNIQLPSCDKAEKFIEELLEIDEVVPWLQGQGYKSAERFSLSDTFKLFSDKIFPLIQVNKTFDLKDFKSDLIQEEKIRMINLEAIRIDHAQAKRMLDGSPEEVQEIVSTCLKNERKPEFLFAIDLTKIKDEGLSKEIIEWILVSQGIFLPQSSSEIPPLPTREVTSKDRDIVCGVSAKPNTIEVLSDYTKKGKKLPHGTLQNKRVELLDDSHYEISKLTSIHKKAWKQNRSRLLEEEYPDWKRITLCYAPSRISDVLDYDITKVATAIATVILAIYSTYKFYYLAERIIPQYIVPFFINKSPIEAVRMVNMGMKSFDYMKNNSIKIIFGILFAKFVLNLIPLDLTRRAAQFISLDIISMNKLQFQQLVIHQFITLFWLGDGVRKIASTSCKKVANRYTNLAYEPSRKRFIEAARLMHKESNPPAA